MKNETNNSDQDGFKVFLTILLVFQLIALNYFLWGEIDKHFSIMSFFILGILVYSLGRSYSTMHGRIRNFPKALAGLSLLIMVLGIIVIIITSFDLVISKPGLAEEKLAIFHFKEIKSLEGGLLAITALVVSIVSGVYIWSLQTTKASAEILIQELKQQKITSDNAINELQRNFLDIKEIPNIYEELKKIESIAIDRIPHLRLLQRIAINNSEENRMAERFATYLLNIIDFEEAALDLINHKKNEKAEQVSAVTESLQNIEGNGSSEYLSPTLVKYLIKLLESSEFEQDVTTKNLTHKLNGLLLKEYCD